MADDDEEGAFDIPTVKGHVNKVRRRVQRPSAPVVGCVLLAACWCERSPSDPVARPLARRRAKHS